jgi:hypothetical protein
VDEHSASLETADAHAPSSTPLRPLPRPRQVLDDGRVTDSQGRTVSFKNCVIIMTSNLGSSHLLEAELQGGHEGAKELVRGGRGRSGHGRAHARRKGHRGSSARQQASAQRSAAACRPRLNLVPPPYTSPPAPPCPLLPPHKKTHQVMGAVRAHFRPEFVNRIDEFVVFDPLRMDQIKGIVKLQVGGQAGLRGAPAVASPGL